MLWCGYSRAGPFRFTASFPERGAEERVSLKIKQPRRNRPVQAQKRGAPADCAGDESTSRCRELGVEAALSEIAGISPPMLVALGENGIKTVEDLAGCPPMICMAGSSRQAARPRATWARSTASGSRAT